MDFIDDVSVLYTQCVSVLQTRTVCRKKQRYRSECPFATSTLTLIAGFMSYMGEECASVHSGGICYNFRGEGLLVAGFRDRRSPHREKGGQSMAKRVTISAQIMYLLVSPAGRSDRFHVWITSFVVP